MEKIVMNGGLGYLGAAHNHRKWRLSKLSREELYSLVDAWNRKSRWQKFLAYVNPFAYDGDWIRAAKEVLVREP